MNNLNFQTVILSATIVMSWVKTTRVNPVGKGESFLITNPYALSSALKWSLRSYYLCIRRN